MPYKKTTIKILNSFQDFFQHKDIDKLSEMMLELAMEITSADAGRVYLVNPDNRQESNIRVLHINSLNVKLCGEETRNKFPPVCLLRKNGEINLDNIATSFEFSKKALNINNASENKKKGVKGAPQQSTYESHSLLASPISNSYGEVIGLIQLNNAKNTKNETIEFSKELGPLVQTCSDIISLAFENINLINEKNNALINLLSKQKIESILEEVLKEAMKITRSDGGTIYYLIDNEKSINDGKLRAELLINKSLGIELSGKAIYENFPLLPLFIEGKENHSNIATYVATSKKTVNIDDIHNDPNFDSSGAKRFDKANNYNSKSCLCIPLLNYEGDVTGVIQLINAKDYLNTQILPFSKQQSEIVSALAQYAAISISLQKLISDHKKLLDSFVRAMAEGIDAKSLHTSSHCQRIPILMDMLVNAACKDKKLFPNFNMSDEDKYEVQVASWLHDCGKLSTPDYLLDKATKLHLLRDGIEDVRNRFLILKLQTELELHKKNKTIDVNKLEKKFNKMEEDLQFIIICNKGGEFMADKDKERVKAIANYKITNHQGNIEPLLSQEEVDFLCIEKGTISAEERKIINNHIQVTIDMLESLHFPKGLKNVPEIAGGHHERIDGRGYPKGLTGEEMSIPARMMAIADIFEALTSKDRPYKSPMKLSMALKILKNMANDQHIDKKLFKLFLKHNIWQIYAKDFLNKDQLDVTTIESFQ